METIKLEIKGIAPLLMHNGQLADPINPHTKALKAVTGKRKKSDDDHMEIARLEFMGSLYVDEKERPVITSDMIESMVFEGAKKSKRGKDARSQTVCIDHCNALIFDFPGKVSADALWKSGKFYDTRGVRVTTSRCMRTRPRFNSWSCKFTLGINGLNAAEVIEWVSTAGELIGIGDFRPKFGRFEVVSAS